MGKPKLFLVCTGLGLVSRGFETYISDLADKLAQPENSFSVSVFSGGEYSSKVLEANKVFCISRNNKLFNKLLGASPTSELEQFSFFISFIFHIIQKKPKAIYLGEYKLYCYLYKFRKFFKFKYSLVLYTGGQVSPGLFDQQKDYVHHVTDVYYQSLVSVGIPANRQFVLPHFISISESASHIDKLATYNTQEKKIIISIGLIDNVIKKMDLFVKVLAKNNGKFFPVILGDTTLSTPAIEDYLEKYFGDNNYYLGKVQRNEIGYFLSRADVFMLLSPRESFGLAAVEALSYGLPVICHSYYESNFVLKDMAYYFSDYNEDQLYQLLETVVGDSAITGVQEKRKRFVRLNYDWSYLSRRYINMFTTILFN